MSANIRIAQQLSTGYNPDGTPGTVSTGVPGPAGAPATDAQVAAAVASYLTTHPVSGTSSTATATLTKYGVGASGLSGAWVGLGDNSTTVTGYVVAGGSIPDVDLHVAAKGQGKVYFDSPLADVAVTGNITVSQDLHIVGQLVFDNTTTGGIVAPSATMGLSTFDTSSGMGFNVQNQWVSIQPYGGQGNPAGVSIWNPIGGVYAPIKASAFTVSSDRRWKSEISELSGALAEVRTTPAYSYVMGGERRRGLIADEAPADVVRTDDSGYQLIESYDLVGTLWAAVRELADKLEGMEQTCRCPQTR